MSDRATVDAALKDFLNRALATAPQRLAESIRYSVLSDGKRIRPRLVLEAGRLLDLSQDEVLPLAMALELGHAFTLIHDDLPCMDNDSLRRGLPTNHIVFGEGMALLAGDAVFALAHEALLPLGPRLAEPLRIFSQAMGPRGVMGGQALEEVLRATPSLSGLRTMHRLKTGALFEASILMPLAVATREAGRVSPQQHQALTCFASNIGAAFQLADDLDDQESAATSILHYVSPEQASSDLAALIDEASQKLRQVFGDRAQSLCAIADSLRRPVRASAVSPTA